jgi:palmitoyl-protein thioesterase
MKHVAVFLCLVLIIQVWAYRPVVLMHGLGSYTSMNTLVSNINKYHPGTLTYNVNAFNNADDTTPLWTQINDISAMIYSFIAQNQQAFANGFHLIGHSQGILCQTFSNLVYKYLPTVHNKRNSHYSGNH